MTEDNGTGHRKSALQAAGRTKVDHMEHHRSNVVPEAPRPDVRALFLGPKSENRAFFESSVRRVVEEHVHWRRDYHPEDQPVVTAVEMADPAFRRTRDRTEDILNELTDRLKSTSTPWFSTRYLGHMNSDTLLISNLAEIATILYNPNNVAYESSIATSNMEAEVGRDLTRLLGYSEKGWGHITADGTVANYEGLWLARNLASLPFAIRDVVPDLVAGKSDWELANVPTDEALTLLDEVKKDGDLFKRVLARTARGLGAGAHPPGKVLVPGTRHYSWDKACDILGIGVENLVKVPLDDRYRMDLKALQQIIDELVASRTPILALVSVVGTTEESAIDDIVGVHDLIRRNRANGVNFYFHIDAAYGGYARSLFVDKDGKFLEYDELRRRMIESGLDDGSWPRHDVWASYREMPAADSITIDPHKMGYIPYAAGGIAFRDRRILGLASYSAAYVFEKSGADNLDTGLGSVTLEGSKAGMTAAGVWAAHRLLPLHHDGFGQVIARSWQGAHRFMEALGTVKRFTVGKHEIVCELLLENPDFNMICMAFNVVGNTSLSRMNALNHEIYHRFSYEYGPLYGDDWITSHTVIERAIYGDGPADLCRRLGLPADEWKKVGSVTLLRSTVMHPWLGMTEGYPQHWQSFRDIITGKLAEILPSWSDGTLEA